MTITPKQARAKAMRATADTSYLAAHLPAAIQACLDEIYNPATGAGGRLGKGNISDPTLATVIQREQRVGVMLEDEIEVPLASLDATIAILVRFTRKWEPVEPSGVTHVECFGGRNNGTWGDPACRKPVDHWVNTKGEPTLRGDGLCMACRKRKERSERDQQAEVA